MKSLLISAVFVSLTVVAAPVLADELGVAERPHLSVSGDAEVKIEPDFAIFRIALIHHGRDLVGTRRANQAATTALLDLARRRGVQAMDLSTTPSMAFPGRWQCSTCSEADQKTGYTARTEATLTLRRMADIGDFATEVSADPNVQLQDVEYHTSQLRTYRDQARALAIRAAREKAEALSKELGQSIGKAMTISEDPAPGMSYWSWSHWGYACCGYYSSYGRYGNQGMVQNVSMVAPSGGNSVNDGALAPGSISVKARVNVTFELH